MKVRNTNAVRLAFYIANLVFCLTVLNGCVVISDSPSRLIDGKDYPFYKINNIAKGKSTKSGILEMFGKPYLEYNDKWVYYYLKESNGVIRLWFIGIPVHSTITHYEDRLIIPFKDGIVEDYILGQNETE
jgi:hypothetical protein